jgi:hypothetical protein
MRSCDETACIQQAFRYVNQSPPLVPTIQELLPPLEAADGDSVDSKSDNAERGSAERNQASSDSSNSADAMDEQYEPLDLQRASRLSYASLQWLPESTVEVSLSCVVLHHVHTCTYSHSCGTARASCMIQGTK